MATYNKGLIARGLFTVFTCAVLSIGLGSSKHLLSTGSAKVIAMDHQIRRVLWRVERETLRDGATVQQTSATANASLLLDGVSLSTATKNHSLDGRVFWTPRASGETNHFILDLSPVLNL